MAVVMRAFLAQEASDAEVIKRSWREPECFATLFGRYYGQIHGYAARRLGPGLADDVAAETFLAAFTARSAALFQIRAAG
jgi:DNA-directed RNA polymerase specialized sigma24 family protein